MVFSSIEFLFFFLPAALALYLVSPRPLRNLTLLLASLLFYTWGGGVLVLLLLGSVAANYLLGLVVATSRGVRRRAAVAVAVALNLGILGVFKYLNFGVAQWNAVQLAFGGAEIDWAPVALPIGISFYTFQSMSYILDVNRGAARVLRNPVDFGLYVSMFPQLIAGPIVRFHEISEQIADRRLTVAGFGAGALRFSHGLVKKVVVADSLAVIADAVFELPADSLAVGSAWIGLLAYTLQIYFDFSGYSDMAIGLGAMLGFRLPENFHRPYSALSVTDFWRRWHITLSNWFRDYLYFPLGGSHGTRARTYANLVTVFLLVGLWHGAQWTFVVWGAYHGALLVFERATGRRFLTQAPGAALQRALTFLLIMLGWVVFRSESLEYAGAFYTSLLSLGGVSELAPQLIGALTVRNSAILLLASLVVLLPRELCLGPTLENGAAPWVGAARAAILLLGLPYAFLLIMSGTYSPFLYFQF